MKKPIKNFITILMILMVVFLPVSFMKEHKNEFLIEVREDMVEEISNNDSYEEICNNDSYEEIYIKPPKFDLIIQESILIDSDDGFVTYGFSGSGISVDPYILEGYNITNSNVTGIQIKNTSKYFIIRDCYIDTEGTAILIGNVTTGTVQVVNNSVFNNNGGIGVSYSNSSTIANNTFVNNYGYGFTNDSLL